MDTLLKLSPLIILLVAAFVMVWRGLGANAHDKGKTKGGGPDFPGKNLF